MKIMSGLRGGSSAGVRGRFPLHYPVMHIFAIIPTDIAHESVMSLSSSLRSRVFDGHPQTRRAQLKLYSRGNTFDARA